ncbi:MAG: hypothetical protein RIQ68_146 [Pseudomonadota bacterium]|jgi:uncharacterized iron-regulated membrane protein
MLSQSILLKIHRWISILFALPLAIVIVTGLILSFQPIAQFAAIKPGALSEARLIGLIQKHDPKGEARSLSMDPVQGILSLSPINGTSLKIDLANGEIATKTESFSAKLFSSSRRIHERLMFGLDPLVPLSTAAMLVLIGLGLLMGLPHYLRNDLTSWHKWTAWTLLPLLIISPLSGLALTFNITFTDPLAREPALPLIKALQLTAAFTEPANILFIANRGGRQIVRTMEDGAVKTYTPASGGLRSMAPNWPRLIHEGNWAGLWSGGLNALTAAAMILLLGTGLTMWLRRSFRQRRPRATSSATA